MFWVSFFQGSYEQIQENEQKDPKNAGFHLEPGNNQF